MLYRVTHTASDGTPRGINTATGETVYVAPGQTSAPVAINDHEAAAMRDHQPWFTLEEVSEEDAAKHAETLASRGPKPEDTGAIVDPSDLNERIARDAMANGGQDTVEGLDDPIRPNFDAMTDDALRAFLTDAEVTFHPNTGRPKLLAKAEEVYQAAQDAEAKAKADAEAAGNTDPEPVV